MSTLFANNNEGGYRLRSFEVFNWGTFDGRVYKITPNGRTSLLTGANGSGKTTLVDALLTLLVPSGKRFYNQSSGAESKKERDELSYFWGYFGKTFSDAEEVSKTEQLRHKSDNHYSVLLGCFQNSATLHTITLVQVRWFSGGGLKKVFVFSPYPLSISEHFGKGQFDLKGEWRKKLSKIHPKTEFFDSFKEYSSRFSEAFGLGEKALSLFNQTVGIKVLGDLTAFVRSHMLEEPNSESQFSDLYSHYSDLLLAYKAIQKDEAQLNLLSPIIETGETLGELDVLKESYSLIDAQAEHFLNTLELDLLDSFIELKEIELNAKQSEKRNLESIGVELTNKKDSLISQKAALNIDGQMQLLRQRKNSETEWKVTKERVFREYETLAVHLNLNTDLNEEIFLKNYSKVLQLSSDSLKCLENLRDGRGELKTKIKIEEDRIDECQRQISYYLNRRSRIPEELTAIRDRLIKITGAGEIELPFVGELVQVKADETKWRDSIERVLHGFAMNLIVPERYIQTVNEFIHKNDLRTKLVYLKYDKGRYTSLKSFATGHDYLIDKVELKDDSFYFDWLEAEIVNRFNYLCTDDLEVFNNSKFALTSNGLIRSAVRHEKDDRPNVWTKGRYRLGWDSTDTVLYYQESKFVAEKAHKLLQGELAEISRSINVEQDRSDAAQALKRIESYYDLDWKTHVGNISSIEDEIASLEGSNDAYKTILKQLTSVEKDIESNTARRDEIIKEIGRLQSLILDKSRRKLSLEIDKLTDYGRVKIESYIDQNKFEYPPFTLDGITALASELGKKIKGDIQRVAKDVERLTAILIEQCVQFVRPSPSLLSEHPDWTGDVLDLRVDISYLQQYKDLYVAIKGKRLVENRRRFQEYMDRSMLDSLTNFRAWLRNEEDKIREVISDLNIPLKKITFNSHPDTYLQLECKSTRDPEIKNFKEQLNDAIPQALDIVSQDESFRMTVFEKIRKFISELKNQELWRKKVIDVRNWLTYGARELNLLDNNIVRFHDNTASYSGGQKAQFTYAILGAAISHQFGIQHNGRNSRCFRFIVVDEAFSKLDPEKSRFLMEFCDQLNLQLLVVTPLDKINIAEPYISAVHYVEIKNKRNSILFNLTMEEYGSRKSEFELSAS